MVTKYKHQAAIQNFHIIHKPVLLYHIITFMPLQEYRRQQACINKPD